jgi:hypothetical protein
MNKLPGAADHALQSFANAANWTTLHQKDLDRFYDFVVIAHEEGRWSAEHVQEYLSGYVVNFPLIKRLVNEFEIGTRVLARQKALRAEAE